MDFFVPPAWRRPFYQSDLLAALPAELLSMILDMLDDASFVRVCACARWLRVFVRTRAIVARPPRDTPWVHTPVPPGYRPGAGACAMETGRPYRRRHRVNRARCYCMAETRDFRRDPPTTCLAGCWAARARDV